jgi:hypothetical protein
MVACALFLPAPVLRAQTGFPPDAREPSCLDKTEVAGWFDTSAGKPAGYVQAPENGDLKLKDMTCPYFKAAAHMFLWLTSPAPSEYGGGSHVFNSPLFYEVSPAFDEGNSRRRNMKRLPGPTRPPSQVVAAVPEMFTARLVQTGALGGAMVFDNEGKIHELRSPAWIQVGQGRESRRIEIAKTEIKRVEFAKTEDGAYGKMIFFDQAGKLIPNVQIARSRNLVLLDRYLRVIIPTGEIRTPGGKRYLTDDDGNLIDDEPGQADDGSSVLMAQPASPTALPQSNQLIYFAIRVNDVYAELLTKAAGTSVSGFPTSPAEIKTLLGRDFPDISVLTVELKTAWIDVKGLKAGEEKNYITVPAKLPVYQAADPKAPTKAWNRVRNTSNPTNLALVGMHVVFSAKNHPEMLWATFEHIGNTPDSEYLYQDGSNLNKRRKKDTSGTWLFSSAAHMCDGNEILPHMKFDEKSGAINALPGDEIGPTDVCRINAWGGGTNDDNTNIIGINKMIHAALGNDVRSKYVLIGVTWSKDGKNPVSDNFYHGGTWKLANSTMETFIQNRLKPGESSGGSDCLVCHRDWDATRGSVLQMSHIWSELNPLRRRSR